MSASACSCGGNHPEGARYFVSVADAGKVGLLAGPYETHGEALAVVDEARLAAHRVDPWSQFYAFGTVAMSPDCEQRGVLNHLLAGAQ